MTLNLSLPEQKELTPKIIVFGVGGAGGNAVNNMIAKELEGVEFVVANTDAQALQNSKAKSHIQMGIKLTEGLGAGADASVGAAAAEESIDQVIDQLSGVHMCFITAGMGGGTGTGAAPIIARAARELGILTVGVVTKPFQFEGDRRMKQAEVGVAELQKVVDTLITIPNQNLYRIATENTTFSDAFSMADDVLYQGVKGVTDLMVRPGLINLDFADVRAVMNEMGKAIMGTGEASGEDRALQAAEKAIANPLLDDVSLKGATGVLINITGGSDLTLFELDEAASRIRKEVDTNANIIVGSSLDATLDGVMQVSVVATGIDASKEVKNLPESKESMPDTLQREEPTQDELSAAHTGDNLFAEELPLSDESYADEPVQEVAAEETPYADEVAVEAELPFAQPSLPNLDHVPPAEPSGSSDAPSSETLARLRAAVEKQNHSPDAPTRGTHLKSVQTFAPRPEAQEGRFNSLINRMTGQSEKRNEQPPFSEMRRSGSQVTAVQQDVAEPAAQEEAVDPQTRIEIPAFLRRLAN